VTKVSFYITVSKNSRM